MGGLEQIIGFIIDFINKQVSDALQADVLHRVFKKEGEIQTAVTNNLQQQYSNLEDSIGQAAILQYQSQLEDETKKKVVSGNIISVTAAVFIIIMIVLAVYILMKK